MEVFKDKGIFSLYIINICVSTLLCEQKRRRKVGKKGAPAESLMFARILDVSNNVILC